MRSLESQLGSFETSIVARIPAVAREFRRASRDRPTVGKIMRFLVYCREVPAEGRLLGFRSYPSLRDRGSVRGEPSWRSTRVKCGCAWTRTVLALQIQGAVGSQHLA